MHILQTIRTSNKRRTNQMMLIMMLLVTMLSFMQASTCREGAEIWQQRQLSLNREHAGARRLTPLPELPLFVRVEGQEQLYPIQVSADADVGNVTSALESILGARIDANGFSFSGQILSPRDSFCYAGICSESVMDYKSGLITFKRRYEADVDKYVTCNIGDAEDFSEFMDRIIRCVRNELNEISPVWLRVILRTHPLFKNTAVVKEVQAIDAMVDNDGYSFFVPLTHGALDHFDDALGAILFPVAGDKLEIEALFALFRDGLNKQDFFDQIHQ